jgi:hypothetical protein
VLVLFDAGLLDELDARETAHVLTDLLQALVRANLAYLRKHRTPHPYKSGVRYQRETKRDSRTPEHFCGVRKVLERGHGDCEDLASWLVAHYLARGEKARIVLKWGERDGARLYHVLVRNPAGELEDPSRVLGM